MAPVGWPRQSASCVHPVTPLSRATALPQLQPRRCAPPCCSAAAARARASHGHVEEGVAGASCGQSLAGAQHAAHLPGGCRPLQRHAALVGRAFVVLYLSSGLCARWEGVLAPSALSAGELHVALFLPPPSPEADPADLRALLQIIPTLAAVTTGFAERTSSNK